MRSPKWLALFVVLSGCADCLGCEGDKIEGSSFPQANAASESAGPSGNSTQPTAATAAIKPGPIVPWESFKAITPDTFDEYQADGDASGRMMDLPAGAKLSTLKRKYTKGESKLELELIDSAQSPGVRELFSHASQMNRTTELSIVRPASVKDHPALAQWNKASGIARVGILVADRLIVNVNLKPATSPDAALALAEKLDFAALERLAAIK